MMRVSGSEITHAQATRVNRRRQKLTVAQKRRHIDCSVSFPARQEAWMESTRERGPLGVDARVNGRAKERNGRASKMIVYPEAK